MRSKNVVLLAHVGPSLHMALFFHSILLSILQQAMLN
jgi:hypothetical protein